jgi:hypothetical protein
VVLYMKIDFLSHKTSKKCVQAQNVLPAQRKFHGCHALPFLPM